MLPEQVPVKEGRSHDWSGRRHVVVVSSVALILIYFVLSVYQIQPVGPFLLEPGGDIRAIVLSNFVYDGPYNSAAIVVSSLYLVYSFLELPQARRYLAALYPAVVVAVPALVNALYLDVAVGRFCELPCTSWGMSIAATTSLGFGLLVALGGLGALLLDLRDLAVPSRTVLRSSAFFIAYLVMWLLFVETALTGVPKGVFFDHAIGILGGIVCGGGVAAICLSSRNH